MTDLCKDCYFHGDHFPISYNHTIYEKIHYCELTLEKLTPNQVACEKFKCLRVLEGMIQ